MLNFRLSNLYRFVWLAIESLRPIPKEIGKVRFSEVNRVRKFRIEVRVKKVVTVDCTPQISKCLKEDLKL